VSVSPDQNAPARVAILPEEATAHAEGLIQQLTA
jgi:hypothetical protein